MFLEAQRRYGEGVLDRFLRALYNRFAGTRDATTALFLQEAEKMVGQDAGAFFRDTLYRSGNVGEPEQTR